jgi:hypothetical protein
MRVRLAAWMPNGDVRCLRMVRGGVMFRLLLRQRNGYQQTQPNLGLALRWVVGLAAI